MAEPRVRMGQLADVALIICGYEWLFEPPGSVPPNWDPDRATAALRRAIRSDSAVVFIATADDELLGFCTAYEDIESVRFGQGVWIEDLAVHPAHRSRGIGKQLLDEAKSWARSHGATRVQLVSSEFRTSAHRFYEREQPDWRSFNYGWQL